METSKGTYRTIKALVFGHVHRTAGRIDYGTLTAEVMKHFPRSKWKRTHWAWYRYQITKGRFRELFSQQERAALRAGTDLPFPPAGELAPLRHGGEDSVKATRGPAPREPEVKRLGDPILNHVRFVISLAAAGDEGVHFKLNRWIFARLQHDEIRVKRPIKHRLWQSGMRGCVTCGQRFSSIRNVEIHRKDPSQPYSVENCELLCRECHREIAS